MPLVLNAEQNMLKDAAKDFCTNNTPITQMRKLRDDKDESGFDRDTWSQMVELGWAGITIPEDFGGLGFGIANPKSFDSVVAAATGLVVDAAAGMTILFPSPEL